MVLGLRPDPSALLSGLKDVRMDTLKKLSYHSILSAGQFDRETLLGIYKLSCLLQLGHLRIRDSLYDKILATAFFEPSTRTRLSFESAMMALGGKTLSVTEAATTGIAKGESILDIGQMFNSYAHAVVVRHTRQEALAELSTYLRIPLINGGNGSDEHPTQAIADWYAILKWRPDLLDEGMPEKKRIHLGIVGTPARMRTIKSFLLLSLLFDRSISRITIISEMADPLGAEMPDYCRQSRIPVDIASDLEVVLPELDVIYMNSIAYLGDGYRTLESRFRINAQSSLRPGSVVLHPLARKEELSVELDTSSHNLYFNQADGAVFIRKALLLTIFDKIPLPVLS